MLVPNSAQRSDSGKFQTAAVVLPAGTGRAKNQVHHDCKISGEIFSLHSDSAQSRRRWIVRSPSSLGWHELSLNVDIDAQWKVFVHGLVRMTERGCFPSGLSSLFIRSAIAQKLPLPANEVPRFMYSDQGEDFVDLAAGMEIRIQRVLPGGKSVSSRSAGTSRMSTADYEIVSRRGGGVRLKLNHDTHWKEKLRPGSQDKEIFAVPKQFARARTLRVLLQGFSGNSAESDAILIGASDERQLDILTALIDREAPATCVNYSETVCAEFPIGSVSLASMIWVNGHRTSCPFGTPLSHLLFSLPLSERGTALKSIRVLRRLSDDDYALIQFPRTLDGAGQLLLLPGDKVQWITDSHNCKQPCSAE